MNGFIRLTQLFFFLFVGLPLAISTIWYWYSIGSMNHEVNRYSETSEYDPRNDQIFARGSPIASHQYVTGHKEKNHYKESYRSLARASEIEARSISVTIPVEPKEFLKPGEALPSKENMDLFVSARSTPIGKRECALIEENLAQKCVVARSSTSSNRSGVYFVHLRLNYFQKAPFGTVSEKDELEFREAESKSMKDTRSSSFRGRDLLNLRRRYYNKIAKECDFLRRREGNCAITSARIASQIWSRKNQLQTTARAEFAFLK
ncbi:MAG: hypothetical protein AAF468_01245 [Pseudomonadota bacterium]